MSLSEGLEARELSNLRKGWRRRIWNAVGFKTERPLLMVLPSFWLSRVCGHSASDTCQKLSLVPGSASSDPGWGDTHSPIPQDLSLSPALLHGLDSVWQIWNMWPHMPCFQKLWLPGYHPWAQSRRCTSEENSSLPWWGSFSPNGPWIPRMAQGSGLGWAFLSYSRDYRYNY